MQFGTALLSGIFAAVLTQGSTLWLTSRRRREDRWLYALTLALMMENYAVKCAGVVDLFATYADAGGEAAFVPSDSPPDLPEYPKEIEWRAIGPVSTEALLTFRVSVSVAKMTVRSLLELGDEQDELWWAACGKSDELGLKALQIAKELREGHGLPKELSRVSVDVATFVTSKSEDFAKRKKDFENRKS